MVDSTTGNVGVQATSATTTLTVNGVISAVGNVIKDVATPSEDFDAANKAYVDAVSGGASFTLFGTGKTLISANPFYPPTIQVAGGTGVPACPAGYNSILDGYGPHGLITASGYANSPFWWGPINDPLFCADEFCGGGGAGWTRAYVNNAVAATYSTCSASAYHIVPTTVANYGNGNNTNYYNYFTAKACERFISNTAPNTSFEVCNTCRICVKGLPSQQGSLPGGNVPPDTRWL